MLTQTQKLELQEKFSGILVDFVAIVQSDSRAKMTLLVPANLKSHVLVNLQDKYKLYVERFVGEKMRVSMKIEMFNAEVDVLDILAEKV